MLTSFVIDNCFILLITKLFVQHNNTMIKEVAKIIILRLKFLFL